MKKYDIFISYRREGGEFVAKNIQEYLSERGFRVFFDMESLNSGYFNEKLLEVISQCRDVIVILSPGALDRCENEDDWVRQELTCAFQGNKHVLPIILRDFEFPEELPREIDQIRACQGLHPSLDFWDESMEKLEASLSAKRMLFLRLNWKVTLACTICIFAFFGILWTRKDAVFPFPAVSQSVTLPVLTSSPPALGELEKEGQWAYPNVWGSLTLNRKNVKRIRFLDTAKNAPEDCWDASAAKDGSVLVWLTQEGELVAAGNGGVTAPEDASFLFAGFENLEEIDFGDHFHTNNVTNMEGLFLNCLNLRKLDLTGLQTENVTNMAKMFFGCSALTELNLTGLQMESVENAAYMFYQCESLEELDFSNMRTGSLREMKEMFAFCSKIKALNLSGFHTENVTDMQALFKDCVQLEQINLDGWNTANVTNMAEMFRSCSALTELDVSHFDTALVESMEFLFYGCSSLEKLDISVFHTGNVKSMKHMFSYCERLTQLDVSGFDTSQVTNMASMFEHCASLTELDMSRFNTSKVRTMDFMFWGCSSLRKLYVGNLDTSSLDQKRDMFRDCTSLKEIPQITSRY